MSVIRNRLKKKNGASIFMGLMFLLVCVMVGTVVLTASTAAAGKLAEQRKREQDYLNVTSAAHMLKDRISKLTYRYERAGSGLPTVTLTASDGKAVVLEGELKELCNILAEDTDPASDPAVPDTSERNFTISLQEGAAPPDRTWEIVYGRLSVKKDGRIFVNLWLGGADEAAGNNPMRLEFCPDGLVKETKVTSTEAADGTITNTTTVTTTCSWPESGCTITKG